MYHQDNAIAVVQRLIRHYKLPISKETIIEKLYTHPEYPSLKSICDSFNVWGIKNYPMRMDREELHETGSPFIAHINDGNEKLAFVPQLNGQSSITYFDTPDRGKSIDTNTFFQHYSGIALLIDPDEKVGETGYQEKKQTEWMRRVLPYAGALSFILLLLFTFTSQHGKLEIGLHYSGFFLIKVIGLALSFLLVQKDLNINSRLADALCGLTKKTNCNSILNTDASRVFGWIHWSDLGLIYFMVGILILANNPGAGEYSIMHLLSLGALGYVVYSIYYQSVIAKVWCPLCLGVQSVFLVEAILSLIFYSEMVFSMDSFLKYLSIAGIITFVVALAKGYFLEGSKSQQQKLQYLKLKRNPDIFIDLLKKGERKTFDMKDQTFLIGSKQAPVKVTAFLSLHCKPCQKAFNQLKVLVGNESVAVYLIFSLHDDKIKPFINKVGQLFQEDKAQDAIQLLDDWYNGNQRVQTIEKCESSKPKDRFDSIQQAHNGLFSSAQIQGTPTVFVNGYELPKEYEIADIPNFIDILLSKHIASR